MGRGRPRCHLALHRRLEHQYYGMYVVRGVEHLSDIWTQKQLRTYSQPLVYDQNHFVDLFAARLPRFSLPP